MRSVLALQYMRIPAVVCSNRVFYEHSLSRGQKIMPGGGFKAPSLGAGLPRSGTLDDDVQDWRRNLLSVPARWIALPDGPPTGSLPIIGSIYVKPALRSSTRSRL